MEEHESKISSGTIIAAYKSPTPLCPLKIGPLKIGGCSCPEKQVGCVVVEKTGRSFRDFKFALV